MCQVKQWKIYTLLTGFVLILSERRKSTHAVVLLLKYVCGYVCVCVCVRARLCATIEMFLQYSIHSERQELADKRDCWF